MAKSSKNASSDLLAAIRRTAPAFKELPAAGELSAAPAESGAPPAVRPDARPGRAVQFWMHEEDRRTVRELAAWLAGQGVRATDSLVIRAALRATRADGRLLDAYHEAAGMDGRLKSRRPPESVK